MAHIQISAIIPATRSEVFDFLSNPDHLPHLLKDHATVENIHSTAPLKRGVEVEFLMTRFGFSQPVRLRVEDWLRGTRLTYKQSEGLFSRWVHTCKFEDHGEKQTLVTDIVDYEMPMGVLGHLANDLFVRRDLTHMLQARLEQAKVHFTSGS